jgi:hypothetical protein
MMKLAITIQGVSTKISSSASIGRKLDQPGIKPRKTVVGYRRHQDHDGKAATECDMARGHAGGDPGVGEPVGEALLEQGVGDDRLAGLERQQCNKAHGCDHQSGAFELFGLQPNTADRVLQ